ncbi:MAG: YceI family protein [Tepidisphaeraceae bacterium]
MIRRIALASLAALSLTALTAPTLLPVARAAMAAEPATFKIDGVHSTVMFRIIHMGVSPSYGRFDDVAGTFKLSDSALDLDITIDVTKIDTDNAKRDEHLKGPDFFNVQQFPQATFKSKSSTVADGTYSVTGDLSIKGRTKEVTINLKKIGEGDRGPQMGYRAGFEGHITINRDDFGVDGFPQALSKEVDLTIALEGSKQ